MKNEVYKKRMLVLIKNDCSNSTSLEKSILNAHQTIEQETKTFINLSVMDILTFKQIVKN